jgi:MraZ protein
LLRGLSKLALDSKGRVAIPARYREYLRDLCGGRIVVTIDPDRCLLIYPLSDWLEVEKSLVALPSTDQRSRVLKRALIGHAEECELDGQGRILLSAPLREWAGLDKRVVLTGQGNKFELWDESCWDSQREDWVEVARQFGETDGVEVVF